MGVMATYAPVAAADGLVIFAGWFRPNGSSAVIDDGETPGVTPARTGAGTYTLTLRDAYTAVVFADAQLGQAVVDDQVMRVKTITTSVVTLVAWDVSGGAAADIAADADSKIHYLIIGRAVTTT